ncbi:MAG: DUF4838 domain-containing protein [Lentisphaerae bacterium]|nr:DUF4838 domain-containing protein [Lentisphaerota bacterium]
MKRSSLLMAVFAGMILAAAPRPLSVGGYKYDTKVMLADVCSKNPWVCKVGTVPIAEYKNFSAVYIGNLIKYEKIKPLLITPESREQLMAYLNDGGTLIVNCYIPLDMMGKKEFSKSGSQIFGFSEFVNVDKAKGVTVGSSTNILPDWQLGMGGGASKLDPKTEVLAWYVMPDGKKIAAATRYSVGKGQVWWISPSLMRLKSYFNKNKKSLGYPDDVGNFIFTPEGNAVEVLKELYFKALNSVKEVEVNSKLSSWGDKPLGAPGNLKLEDSFKNKPALRSGFPKYKPGLVLCDSKTMAVIYPATDNQEIKNLALELKYHLDKMSGKDFKIVDKYPDAKQNAVIIGDGAAAEKFGLKPAHSSRDTVVIKRKGNHLFVGGPVKGASHALSLFLESMGIRYLWPGVSGKVIPKKSVIIAPEIDINETAKLYMARSTRSFTLLQGNYAATGGIFGISAEELLALEQKYGKDAPFNREYLHWHGFNDDEKRLGWKPPKEERILDWGHAYGHLYKDYGKKHPEYFAVQPDGSRKQGERPRLCHSNKDLPKVIAKEKIAIFKKYPYKEAVSLCFNDGGYTSFCLCEECRKLDPVNSMPIEMSVFVPVRKKIKYVALSDRVLHFTNQVVEEILKEVPGKQFCFYAYSAYADRPVKLKPHPSLILFSVACNYTNEDGRQKGLKTIAAWSRFGNPLLWRPNAFWGYRNHLMPQNFGRKMFNDIELMKANNLVGNDIDCFEGIWAFKGFTYYAAAKAQLNYEKVDFETIFDDFCKSGFGKAAPEIKKYHLLLEKISDEQAIKRGKLFDLVTDARAKELQDCLDRAKALVKDDPESLARVEFLQHGMTLGMMHRELYLAKDRDSADYKAKQKKFIESIRDITRQNPFIVRTFRIGRYLDHLRPGK